ncbi:uncharacterized protein Triagg1_8876 [Trichoderma aggressivum f. europaeum]|uniref:Uncharacterized protein n=1 Tax=Trichoderma aggressivum f. europaeum TaxID=173218 RepID=A0AAE1J349_9HYPO|nr:hypothetical protein Triagg1_8876 [Trichoderma aggressivum f. europaeum]
MADAPKQPESSSASGDSHGMTKETVEAFMTRVKEIYDPKEEAMEETFKPEKEVTEETFKSEKEAISLHEEDLRLLLPTRVFKYPSWYLLVVTTSTFANYRDKFGTWVVERATLKGLSIDVKKSSSLDAK